MREAEAARAKAAYVQAYLFKEIRQAETARAKATHVQGATNTLSRGNKDQGHVSASVQRRAKGQSYTHVNVQRSAETRGTGLPHKVLHARSRGTRALLDHLHLWRGYTRRHSGPSLGLRANSDEHE